MKPGNLIQIYTKDGLFGTLHLLDFEMEWPKGRRGPMVLSLRGFEVGVDAWEDELVDVKVIKEEVKLLEAEQKLLTSGDDSNGQCAEQRSEASADRD